MKDPLAILSNFHIHITRDIVWLVFVVACAIAGLFSAVLFFHWRMYGMKNYRIVLAEMVFLVGIILIFMFAFSSAFQFTQ
ncbi:MAG: hypothetical protein U0522_02435 [Candidatus Paceibacterota bacterium]